MEKLQWSDTKYTSHVERQHSINYTSRSKLSLSKKYLERMKKNETIDKTGLVIVNLLCYNPTNNYCYFINTQITLCRKRQISGSPALVFQQWGASILLNSVPPPSFVQQLPREESGRGGESTCPGVRKSHRPTGGLVSLFEFH